MIVAVDTYFVANEPSLERAHNRYLNRVCKAEKHEGISILFTCAEASEIDSKEMQEDLISQFKIERPHENHKDLRLFIYTTIVHATDKVLTSHDEPLTSFFLLDEERAPADAFPSSVGFRKLERWTPTRNIED
ncbi:hypothetical protein [Corynebacterium sp.]|uniref:hypothetical protein n=1 Tax=Corynebacterium sp. TaxID=1720 RepID=UPI0026DCF2AE|nr:hypothetical protein [Corynebacterium sp.]MDO5031933.1 hypothetical protein [Corynebacterium sp.]